MLAGMISTMLDKHVNMINCAIKHCKEGVADANGKVLNWTFHKFDGTRSMTIFCTFESQMAPLICQ